MLKTNHCTLQLIAFTVTMSHNLRKFDADGGGTLDIEEFEALVVVLNVKMNEKEVEECAKLFTDHAAKLEEVIFHFH